MTKNITQFSTQIDLLDDKAVKEASASISLNPSIQWAKIIVTDDKPNLNKQRIPKEEFANLIETGLFAPIKMAESEISRSHKEALGKVIGTITQLIESKDNIIALAALWKKEREEDVNMLKEMYSKGDLPQVSWEISYTESEEEEDGTEALHNTSLDGLTVVSLPAYAGRTSFVAMSSKDNESHSEEEFIKTMDELEQAKAKVAELEAKVDELKSQSAELDQLKATKATLDEEVQMLREYKETKEKEQADASRLEEIKSKFTEAKIEKESKYFDDNKELLLGLDPQALDFMMQELVAFKGATASTKEDDDKQDIPNFVNKENGKVSDPIELGKALRESRKIKQQ